MVRYEDVILAYFIIGVIMWGGGAIDYGETGLVGQFISSTGGGGDPVEVNEEAAQQLEQSGGPIQEAAQQIGGSALLAVWNLIAGTIGYLFWPVGVLVGSNAPPQASILFGGSLTVAFFGGIVRLYIAGD